MLFFYVVYLAAVTATTWGRHHAGTDVREIGRKLGTAIVANAYEDTPGLTDIDLSGLSVTDVEPGAFNGLSKLANLDLRDNQISELKSGVFGGLTELKSLFLQKNKISSIEGGTFSDLRQCWRVYLWENELTVLETNMFQGLIDLTDLYLNENKIRTIEENAFADLGSVKRLSLTENRLTEIKATTFSGLASLSNLYLEDNQISTIEEGVFEGLRRPVVFGLKGNPVDCDRALCWLKHQDEAYAIHWNTGAPTCSNGYNWYDTIWNCPEADVDCGETPDVDFANEYPLWRGVKVSYVCWDCYEGGGIIQCGKDGNWSPAPTCTRDEDC